MLSGVGESGHCSVCQRVPAAPAALSRAGGVYVCLPDMVSDSTTSPAAAPFPSFFFFLARRFFFFLAAADAPAVAGGACGSVVASPGGGGVAGVDGDGVGGAGGVGVGVSAIAIRWWCPAPFRRQGTQEGPRRPGREMAR